MEGGACRKNVPYTIKHGEKNSRGFDPENVSGQRRHKIFLTW